MESIPGLLKRLQIRPLNNRILFVIGDEWGGGGGIYEMQIFFIMYIFFGIVDSVDLAQLFLMSYRCIKKLPFSLDRFSHVCMYNLFYLIPLFEESKSHTIGKILTQIALVPRYTVLGDKYFANLCKSAKLLLSLFYIF